MKPAALTALATLVVARFLDYQAGSALTARGEGNDRNIRRLGATGSNELPARGLGMGAAWAKLLAPGGAAAVGALIGGTLDGKSGAVKDAALGTSISLGFDFERHREKKVEAMTDAFMRNIQEPRNINLIQELAQEVQEHPEQFEQYLADPQWRVAIDSAEQIASAVAQGNSLLETGQDLVDFQRSFYKAVALKKHALVTGAGTGLLAVTPHVIEKILSLGESPESGVEHSRKESTKSGVEHSRKESTEPGVKHSGTESRKSGVEHPGKATETTLTEASTLSVHSTSPSPEPPAQSTADAPPPSWSQGPLLGDTAGSEPAVSNPPPAAEFREDGPDVVTLSSLRLLKLVSSNLLDLRTVSFHISTQDDKIVTCLLQEPEVFAENQCQDFLHSFIIMSDNVQSSLQLRLFRTKPDERFVWADIQIPLNCHETRNVTTTSSCSDFGPQQFTLS